MDVFGTIARWAGDAWNGVSRLAGDVGSATQALWSYVSSILSSQSWILSALLGPGYILISTELRAVVNFIRDLRDALNRVAWWVDQYMITPVRTDLLIRLWVLQAQTLVHFAQLTKLVYILHIVEERHTDVMVAAERQQRIIAINAARKYARDLTQQLHQTIEQEAVSGYRQGSGNRSSLINDLARDLNVRGIIDTVTTNLLTKAVDALVTIDDPVLAGVATRIINVIIRKSGLGADIADLIERLLIPGAGGPAPKNLTGVIADLTHRIGQVEAWIAQFMLDGGPEVEDAGRQWKALNSLVVDAAIVAFLGQAITAPETWAREVDDVIGTVANDTIGSIIDLIHRA